MIRNSSSVITSKPAFKYGTVFSDSAVEIISRRCSPFTRLIKPSPSRACVAIVLPAGFALAKHKSLLANVHIGSAELVEYTDMLKRAVVNFNRPVAFLLRRFNELRRIHLRSVGLRRGSRRRETAARWSRPDLVVSIRLYALMNAN